MVSPSIFSLALHDSFMHLSFVDIAIFEIIFTLTVLLAIASLPFIYSIFVFNGFFQVLKSIGYSFLAKYLLGQVLQLPQYDFKRSFCNFFRWDIWKFAICQQNIKLFNGKSPIFITLKLLQSLYALIYISTPSYNITDYGLNALYIIWVIKDLS